MRVVDAAIFAKLEENGCYVPSIHEDEEDPVVPAGALIVHDGLVVVANSDNVITYPLPYAVYTSSVGADDNPRLTGRDGRRSVFFTFMYVGVDRNQAKWAGERIRDALHKKRVAVTGHRSGLCDCEESQRIRRDDDAARPDGSPLFYGVDQYALSITYAHTR